ncbi:NCK-interacting protein with SH3 domain-like [Anopheles albimanus]|uniref:SH3 domain-containing protein n=1 Tax=Anopheles albimanus TaxID=7167 RepID=A0A182FJ04_ANOAL|nr:NCK-interacting protein with SH3 domain-like [Anopheles albimanus]XP_035773992.1 NCK-interacting protein with SH3 domain-like [Anopheles albimanus]XP_035774002.1 NCK-interacting protein with SH3 domain-like [Anopheles albimanus]
MADSVSPEAECFEMLKALYDFTAVYPKTISFDEGEYFILHQTSARQRNWWQVVSMKGNIGFVPSNYVMKLKVNPNFLNGFLESSIESLRLSTDKEINGIIGRDELISRLLQKKRKLEKLLKYEQSDSESEPPSSPRKLANGHVSHPREEVSAASANGSVSSPHEASGAGKQSSKAGPGVAGRGAGHSLQHQFIPESPSFDVLAAKTGGEPQPEGVEPTAATSAATDTGNSNTISSEVSSEAEATSHDTVTTATLTTTSDELTAISCVQTEPRASKERIAQEAHVDEAGAKQKQEQGVVGENEEEEDGERDDEDEDGHRSAGATDGGPGELGNQTDQELQEMETSNNGDDDVTVSENEPHPPPPDRAPDHGAGGTPPVGSPPRSTAAAPGEAPPSANGEHEGERGTAAPAAGDLAATQGGDGQSPSPSVTKVEPAEVYQIVDAIRNSTRLSHELSCVALRVVLSELEGLLPPAVVRQHLEPIAQHLAAPLDVTDALLGQTHDALRLRVIFAELSDCKNDAEQRTWMLHEDEADISQYLTELIRILTDADPKICRSEMACDHYYSIINLVLYYQMETRWSIRKLLLKAFHAMCHLDYTTVDILLGSVLPLELVQDMVSNARNVEKLQELANMLIIIFSIGRRMSIHQQDHLRADFVIFLLNLIESPPDCDVREVLPDIMTNLILSFNLQFEHCGDNVVLDAMEQLKTAKTFTEKILMLINREEDPVHTLKHTPVSVNPVLKMLVDLFSRPETASIFYTNDNKVLIDILVRQLSDLSAGEPIRKWYLELCRKILRNTNYPEHQHRKQDLMKIFTRIFCEEMECSASDQQIVREIANEFPQIFKA